MRILLAEDDENLNRTLTERLRTKGFDVDSCFDGDEALYYASQNIHDVIFVRPNASLYGRNGGFRTAKKGKHCSSNYFYHCAWFIK